MQRLVSRLILKKSPVFIQKRFIVLSRAQLFKMPDYFDDGGKKISKK